MRSYRRYNSAAMPRFMWILLLCAAVLLTIHYIKEKQDSINNKYGLASFDNPENAIPRRGDSLQIGIVVVIDNDTNIENYRHALQSVECYAKIWNYEFRLEKSDHYSNECPHQNIHFRRHCIVSKAMSSSLDYILLLTPDTGVVYPGRRLEEFIDPMVRITFYERLDDWEVMPSGYLAQNTPWTEKFLQSLASFEFRVPGSYHGDDRGALHYYLCENIETCNATLLPNCLSIYYNSKNDHDLLMFELCIRELLGSDTNFGNVKISSRKSAYSRDSWITNSIWSLEEDFMMRGWKTDELKNYSDPFSLSLKASSRTYWYNPLAGPIDLELCKPLNTSWTYDKHLTRLGEDVVERLDEYAKEVRKERDIMHYDLVNYFSESGIAISE